MTAKKNRLLRLVLGWVCLGIGAAGLLLPIVQGIPFILIGLYLLSHEIPWAARLLNRLKKRYPALYKKFEKLKNKTNHYLNRFFRTKRRN